MFCFETRGALAILRVDNPDLCAFVEFVRMFDQLHELAMTPRSPFAAHENEDDGLARRETLREGMDLPCLIKEFQVRRNIATLGCGIRAGVRIALCHALIPDGFSGLFATIKVYPNVPFRTLC